MTSNVVDQRRRKKMYKHLCSNDIQIFRQVRTGILSKVQTSPETCNLDIVLKFQMSVESMLGYFKRSWTTACSKLAGTTPVSRHQFILGYMVELIVLKMTLIKQEG